MSSPTHDTMPHEDGQTPDEKQRERFVTDFMTQMVDLRQAIIAQHSVIEAAKEALRHLKDAADDLTLTIPNDAPDTVVALAVLSTLYWEYEGTVNGIVVSRALKLMRLDRSNILSHEAEITCPRCDELFYVEVATRTELARVSDGSRLCDECKAEIDTKSKMAFSQHIQARRNEIERLRSMPYGDYLKTDHWQDVRRRALKRSGFRCQLCNASKTALHVHHRTYQNRGDERNTDVIVLCAGCHSTFHDKGELSHE